MPRKSLGEKLEKVVSTKISLADFIVLEKYARIRYNQNKLKQPTISQLLRKFIKAWANEKRKQEQENQAAGPSRTSSIKKMPQKYESRKYSYLPINSETVNRSDYERD